MASREHRFVAPHVSFSDAIVVASGRAGTVRDLLHSRLLMQVEHICETPIVLLGALCSSLVSWLRGTVLPRGFFSAVGFTNLFQLKTREAAVTLLVRVQEDRLTMDHVCSNYDRCRTEFEFRGG